MQGIENKKNLCLVHLSPTGILNQLDSHKLNWWRSKALRLQEEEELVKQKQLSNTRQSIYAPKSSSQSKYYLLGQKFMKYWND